MSIVSSVSRRDTWPVTSVDLVAYLARYAVTAASVISWRPVTSGSLVMTLVSTRSPHAIGQPSGRAGCAAVVKATVAAAWSTAALSRQRSGRSAGGRIAAGSAAGSLPSRRMVGDSSGLHLSGLAD